MLKVAAGAVITSCLPAQYTPEIRVIDALLRRSAAPNAVTSAQNDPEEWLLTALHHIRSNISAAAWESAVRTERKEGNDVCFGSYFPHISTLISTLTEAVPDSVVYLMCHDGINYKERTFPLYALLAHPAALVAPAVLLPQHCYIKFSDELPFKALEEQEVFVMLNGDEDSRHESLLSVISWSWRRETVAKCWHIPGLHNLRPTGFKLEPSTPCSAESPCKECAQFGCGHARPHPHVAPKTDRSLIIHKRPFNRLVNAWKRSMHVWDNWMCDACVTTPPPPPTCTPTTCTPPPTTTCTS